MYNLLVFALERFVIRSHCKPGVTAFHGCIVLDGHFPRFPRAILLPWDHSPGLLALTRLVTVAASAIFRFPTGSVLVTTIICSVVHIPLFDMTS